MKAVVVEDLVKKYGDLEAVAGVSFDIDEGEIFGFLGPNGAGKTTTISVLITLVKPTAGRARIFGYDVVSQAREVRRLIGVVFQDPTSDKELTAYENMKIQGLLYGHGGRSLEERIAELLRFVELEEAKNRQVKYFSGGMLRRLEIAKALIHTPRLLFLDEPTVGLDPHTRAHIWDYIKALRESRGTTIFLTTHYMEEAEALCDRVAIIDRGKLLAIGSPDSLKRMIGKEIVLVRLDRPLDDLSDVFGEETEPLGPNLVEVRVEDATKSIPQIIERARLFGANVVEISYRRPTLNEVFLHLTGRELRDEEAGPKERMATRIRRRMRRG